MRTIAYRSPRTSSAVCWHSTVRVSLDKDIPSNRGNPLKPRIPIMALLRLSLSIFVNPSEHLCCLRLEAAGLDQVRCIIDLDLFRYYSSHDLSFGIIREGFHAAAVMSRMQVVRIDVLFPQRCNNAKPSLATRRTQMHHCQIGQHSGRYGWELSIGQGPKWRRAAADSQSLIDSPTKSEAESGRFLAGLLKSSAAAISKCQINNARTVQHSMMDAEISQVG